MLRQLAAALRRHPLVVLLGIALTLLATHQVSQQPSVWTTRVTMILISPPGLAVDDGTAATNPLLGERSSLVPLAGVLARALDAEGAAGRSGSDTLSLVGLGARHGYSVALPNAGGQWRYDFRRAELDVQVVGRTEADAEALLAEVRERVATELARQQELLGTDPRYRVTVQQSPVRAIVAEVSGNQRRAAAVTFLLGLALTVGAAVLLPHAPWRPHAPGRRGPRRRGRDRGGDNGTQGVDPVGRDLASAAQGVDVGW